MGLISLGNWSLRSHSQGYVSMYQESCKCFFTFNLIFRWLILATSSGVQKPCRCFAQLLSAVSLSRGFREAGNASCVYTTCRNRPLSIFYPRPSSCRLGCPPLSFLRSSTLPGIFSAFDLSKRIWDRSSNRCVLLFF
jgi:hypothetical protein